MTTLKLTAEDIGKITHALVAREAWMDYSDLDDTNTALRHAYHIASARVLTMMEGKLMMETDYAHPLYQDPQSKAEAHGEGETDGD